jgi:hypothetical protein
VKQRYVLALLRKLLAGIALTIAPFALIGGTFYVPYSMNACITEVRQGGIVRSNMQFQITETDCSTLGEDASVNVYGFSASDNDRIAIQVRSCIVSPAATYNRSAG